MNCGLVNWPASFWSTKFQICSKMGIGSLAFKKIFLACVPGKIPPTAVLSNIAPKLAAWTGDKTGTTSEGFDAVDEWDAKD